MGIFGWSYPPGCSGPPEHDETCEICGAVNLDLCICPECPECGEVGNPDCYTEHGMERTQEQLDSLAKAEHDHEERCREEAEYFSKYPLYDEE